LRPVVEGLVLGLGFGVLWRLLVRAIFVGTDASPDLSAFSLAFIGRVGCDLVREAVLETRRQVLDPTNQAHPSLHRPISLDHGTSTPRCLTVQSARANDSIRSANAPIERYAGLFTLLRGSRPRGSKRLLSPGLCSTPS